MQIASFFHQKILYGKLFYLPLQQIYKQNEFINIKI